MKALATNYNTAPGFPYTISRMYLTGSQKDSQEVDLLDYDLPDFYHTLSRMHLSGSHKELWAVDLYGYSAMHSEQIRNRYLKTSCPFNNMYGLETNTISIHISGSFVTDTCTALRNKPVYYGGREAKVIEASNLAGEQKSQSFIDTSADIIRMAHTLFEGAKPLEGKALEILRKTLKKSFKQTPTRL